MNFQSIERQKADIRQQMRELLHGQSASERQKKSDLILRKVSQVITLKKGVSIMFYVSLLEEVDTLPLLKTALESGCVVNVPYVDRKNNSLISVSIQNPETDLEQGSYGILEPKKNLVSHFDVNQLETVLVPGIAFDRNGRRLGRGKGYYDRFLRSLPKKVKTIGLAFDFQILDSIPVNESDIAVQQLITN